MIPKRRFRQAGTYFITSRTWQRRALFTREAECRIFIEVLLRYRDESAYSLHAFVLMPDHFHVLITPGMSASLERAVQYIKGGSAREIRRALNYRFPVWQRGFSDHRIRNPQDFKIHKNYIFQNPVKKGLVVRATDYPWCSVGNQFPLHKIPQGLKPTESAAESGTAEAVPRRTMA